MCKRCHDRPFGGLNVLCCRDFWQLEPPDGGFLGGIPAQFIQAGRKFKAAPTVAHGQALFWSGPENGMQGVTELVECERTDDEWLQEVQNEFRNGCLNANNHAFLHGEPTTVPGSWIGSKATCGNPACQKLGQTSLNESTVNTRKRMRVSTDLKRILNRECSICQKDRKSRFRVAHAPTDFKERKIETAPAILRTIISSTM